MKATEQKLLSEIAEDLNQFLMMGYLNFDSILKKIDPNLNINNIKRLLRIHFVLTRKDSDSDFGVIDFIRKLNKRLRRIKTSIKQETEECIDKVPGRINWKKTINNRYKFGNDKLNIFVCDKREKDYNISENLVLKQLLQIIYEIIYRDLRYAIENEYEWLKDWVDKKELKDVLKKVYLKNIYLKRIELGNIKITNRMIERAKKSRILLYREASVLLDKYRKLMNYDIEPKDAKDLLKNTFINPGKIEVLFELYWIIKIFKQFKNQNPKLFIIEPGENVVAKWELGGYNYILFHDSAGSLSFFENLEDIDEAKIKNDFFKRQIKILKEFEKMTPSKRKHALWAGRPDIILQKYNQEGKVISIFIGEVKYTDNHSYALKGLRELLEYIALIKENNKYYTENSESLFDKVENVKGGLFLDKIPNLEINETQNIKIYQFDLEKIIDL